MTLFTGFWLGYYQFMLVGSMIAALAMPVGILFTTKWWKRPQSRLIFMLSLALGLSFSIVGLRILFGDVPWRAPMILVVVTLLFVSLWWWFLRWLVQEVRARRKRQSKDRTS